MKTKNRCLAVEDIICIIMMILPIAAGICLKVLTTPLSSGVDITGARIYFIIPMPIQDLPITESQINSWLVLISVFGLCLYLTRDLSVHTVSKRQHTAEWLV